MKKRKSIIQPYNRLIGYARVSTREQTLDHQIDALKREGVHDDNLWVEKVSGVYSRRPERDKALMDARAGDTFVVWRLDRLSRKIVELYTIVEELHARGITFLSIQERFDFKSASGKMGFGFSALWASHERNVTIERTQSGMRAARERGKQIGRDPKLTPAQWKTVERLLAKGWTPPEIADKYDISRQTVYIRYNAEKIAQLRGEIEDDEAE